MSSLTRIPLDSANVDIFSGLTKSVLKFYVSEDIVNSIYEFPQHPDKPIALVESEKTAIICSGLMPQYLWLATGGKSQLSQEKLSAAEIDITVSDILQRYATEEQRKAHIDIADLLIQWKQNGGLIPGTPRKVQLNDSNDIEILLEKWFSSEYLPEIHNLINDFDLTPVTEEWLI
ncbi:MAG: hypothetical protein IJB38_03040 [Bacteroidales bacterium]|nr:hypothetical protein [Bacteroidales bacterium]